MRTLPNHNFARTLLAILAASALNPALADDSAPAEAQPATAPAALQPLVVTGSRVAHDPMDLAASVQVIDRDTIIDGQPRVDLSEDLNGVAGLQALNRHNYAQDLQISSRGFGARAAFGTRSIKLITDGIPASMADGQGETSTFNLDQADRIEVLQGPMSAVYGNHAGGVVQLFTREGEGPPTAEASAEYGSYGTWKEDYALLGKQNGVSYLLDDSHFHTNGYRPDSLANRDQQMAKFTFSPTEGGKLTFVANANQQHDTQDPLGLTKSLYLQNPFGPLTARVGTTTYNDLADAFGTRKSINHLQEGLTYDQAFGQDHLQFTVYTGNRHVVQFQSTPPSFTSNAGVVDYARDFYGESLRWIAVREFGPASKLTFTAGIDNDQFEDNRKGYTNFTTTVTTGNLVCGGNAICGVYGSLKRAEDDRAQSTDPYVQAEWAVERWVFTGGLRYSRVNFNVNNTMSNGLTTAAATGPASGDITFSHTTPMVSALYKVNPLLDAYVSASQGFETPTMNEMFYSRSGTGISNVFNFNLKAATTRYYEAGVKSLLNPDTRFTFAAYHILVDNEAVVDVNVNGATAFKNAQTQRDGVEWNVDSQLAPTVNAKLSLTVMRAFYPNAGSTVVTAGPSSTVIPVEAGSHLPGVAEKYAYAEMSWEPVRGFTTAGEFLARSHMYVEDSNTQMAAPGYGIFAWRMMLHQEVAGWKFKEFARLDNIFERTYAGSVIIGDANGRYYETAPGRTGMIGASASYMFY